LKTYKEFLNEEIRKDVIYSPEFKAWFGDWENDPNNSSKILDKNGKPMKMLHGSNSIDIDIFKSTKGHDYNFFTNFIYEAASYGDVIGEYYINARNPFDDHNINGNEIKKY
jgi:hypothetical protein